MYEGLSPSSPPLLRPHSFSWIQRFGLAACALVALLMLLVPTGGSTASPSNLVSHRGAAVSVVLANAAVTGPSYLQLTTTAQPTAICALNTSTCTAGTPTTRVLLTAQASAPLPSWPAVQVAFVIETTAYDGVYDPNDAVQLEKQQGTGSDACANAATGNPLCEESNGVPFFEDHALAVANLIQQTNPNTKVSFAMVDFASACDTFDDYCDQVTYHVDTAQFLPGDQFATAVQTNFKAGVLAGGYKLHDEDLADNFLHSPSITALYGTIAGSALSWSPATHHVIVLMGSAAPRDPAYQVNYCVSGTGMLLDDYPACFSSTCEPSYVFPTGVSPACEGWVHSQDGNPLDSIAALAHNSPNCVNSVGGVCVIDVIDLWDTPTDPYSQGWPKSISFCYQCPTGGLGPGTTNVVKDTNSILLAGCDLAAATGGTWDGPAFYACPDGQAGGLQYVAHGPPAKPNTENPTLMNAFRAIGFGPVLNSRVAVGTNQPMFTYVPYGNIVPASNPQWTTSCTTPIGYLRDCPQKPTIRVYNGAATWGWNWSDIPSKNVMYSGDTWSASFNVWNTGPPYQIVPVDACVTTNCKAAGSGAINGFYTWATYLYPNTTRIVTESFPLAEVSVSLASSPPALVVPPSPPPVPPSIPVLAPVVIQNPVQVALPLQSPLGTLSVQATAAGLLMAGVTRIMLKNKPVAMQIAAKNGPALSKFDKSSMEGPPMGRFE